MDKKMMNNVKWLFFDIGYTLVNEDKCHSKRINDLIKKQKEKHNDFTYNDIYQGMVLASQNYKQPYITALESLGIEGYEPYEVELEVPYDNAKSVLEKLHEVYHIGIIANQSAGTAKRLIEFGLMEYIDLV